ncbi:HSP90 family protein [Gulosibacter chungangensis]|uniref:HSP90 family protein n=1 Tax=Gulosibacter chungangensis TaxID=979746 RepID=UPI001788780B|nr:HSP90 family protein [Gulosibacter chungangensis]
MNKENFQVDLRGIVQILSHHLYSSPRVYVRELIQNARDAVVARLQIDPDLPARLGGRSPIAITVDESQRLVSVRDYGIGLTEADARNLLATIGASSKRQEFAAARRDFLGQFGIGLLSCFLISDQIEVRSRSAKSPESPTMRWVGYGDGTFAVSQAEEPLDEPGTEIRLHARADEAEWASFTRVRILASQFARFLSFPITVESRPQEGKPELVSMQQAPWQLAEVEAAAWCEAELGFMPLAILPLRVDSHGVRGTAFISGVASGSRNRGGDLVYSRGMFVANDNTQLVPEWATFARVVLEAGSLGLTASREALQESAAVSDVQAEIGRQIRAGIEGLEAQSPEAFETFLWAHGESLLAMATGDRQMLDFVARHLDWETSSGRMRLTDMPTWVTYAETRGDFNTYAPLVAAQSGVLVNGSYANGIKVLTEYDRVQTRLQLRRFDLNEVLNKLPTPAEHEQEFAEYIARIAEPILVDHGVAIEVRSFSPTSLMVLHMPAGTAKFDFAEDADDPWAAMLGDTATSARSSTVDLRPKLVLNIRATAVQALGQHLEAQTRTDSIRALYFLSLLQAGQRLNAEEQAGLSDSLHTLLLAASSAAR